MPTQDAVKILAKDLVRTRRYVKKFILMGANIQAVRLKIQTLRSNQSMATAMKGVTKTLQTMNRQVSRSSRNAEPFASHHFNRLSSNFTSPWFVNFEGLHGESTMQRVFGDTM